jgi:hypothetical protein
MFMEKQLVQSMSNKVSDVLIVRRQYDEIMLAVSEFNLR